MMKNSSKSVVKKRCFKNPSYWGTAIMWFVSTLVIFTGCTSVPRVETPIHTSSSGSIFLKILPEPEPLPSHPAVINPSLMQAILSGVTVQEQKGLLQSLIIDNPQSIAAFTPEEISFLTPWLVEAFSVATPEEAIHFHINHAASIPGRHTTGSMFVKDSTLQISLSPFHSRSERSAQLSRPSKSFVRPKQWQINFRPEESVESTSHTTASTPEPSSPLVLAINLPKLAQQLDAPMTGPTDILQNNQNHTVQEDLQDEIQQLQQQLQEQNQKINSLQQQIESE